ncbi:MAG TPA: right-handed parallel beta-helix repeat-containing protein [bacterium]|nr:right-handed parallel beta-helix repeat-containing protein [bacterium]
MRHIRVLSLSAIILTVFWCFPTGVQASALYVPSEYRTIQDAIDAAASGDVVCVGVGAFNEALVLKEGVTLLGSGRSRSVVDAGADAIAIQAAQGSRVSGLSIEEGIIGIDCKGADVVIENNYIQSRYVGIRSENTSPQIFNNSIDAVYVCIMAKGSGAPIIYNNEITGRYVGIWAENISPLVRNNRIAGFEHGIYTIASNGYILNNKVINSLYDGVVVTRGSSCMLSNNAIIDHYERGVSVFDSSPQLQYNIIAQNEIGLFCQDSSPTLTQNCIASNRESDYEGISPGVTDMTSDPLLVGVGLVSSISGANYDTLVCTDAHWTTDSLVGLDLVPNTTGMYIIYGGQSRTFEVLSNTRTSIKVAVDTSEDNYKTLFKCGTTEDYTKAGDTFFVDDVHVQTTGAGWPSDSPCLAGGLGIYGGEYGGDAGLLNAPLVSLSSVEQVYKTNQTVNITADLSNDQSEPIDADLHIVGFIDGSSTFYAYPNWTLGFNAVPYSLTAYQSETIPVLVIPAAAVPPVDFKILAAFTKRGTFELISPISELWFSIKGD